MSSIELRTTHDGEIAELLIDGEDVSHKAKGVVIEFQANGRPRGRVFVEYKADDIRVSGDYELQTP